MMAVRTTRIARVARRGAFGLDERRRPDPAAVEASLRRFLAMRLPEVWPLSALVAPSADHEDDAIGGRILALLLPHGHLAILRIDRDPRAPSATSRAVAERCRALRIPEATISSVEEGRAALRRLGVEPPPVRPGPTAASVFGRA